MLQQIAHYRIEELLGEGSFALVYRAFDQKFERYVALKILKPIWLSDPEAVGRFKQEAKTLAKLRHPHIVDVYDVDQVEGNVYLAQMLVQGESLLTRLKRGPLLWAEMLLVLEAVASALDYAHAQDVVHRDIKPSNILLDKNNQPFLGDFGLVRATEGSVMSSTVSRKGTLPYIPPEVWDAKEATSASDIYALSCVIFEILTGEVLFDGPSEMAVMRKHDRGPQFPAVWPPDVPAGVTEVLQRGLAKNPAERYSRAEELAVSLSALSIPLSGPMVKPTPEPVKISPLPAQSANLPVDPQALTTPIPSVMLDTGRIEANAMPSPMHETSSPMKSAPSPLLLPVTPFASPPQPPSGRVSAKKIGLRRIATLGGCLALLTIACVIVYVAMIEPALIKPVPTSPPRNDPPIVQATTTATQRPTKEATLVAAVRNTPIPTKTPTQVIFTTATPTLSKEESVLFPEFESITFALGATEDYKPIDTGITFQEGITEVHAIFEYSGMSKDYTWERVWYLDGKEALRNAQKWTGDETGVFDYFIDAGNDPLFPGKWVLELYVEDKLLQTGSFTIKAKESP